MSADRWPEMIWYAGALVLVGSALVARRMKFSQVARYVLIWLALFVAVYGLFLLRDDLGALWHRARADLGGAPEAGVVGSTVVVRRAPDGHFWVTARVNGVATRLLVDSGATTTTLPVDVARSAGAAIDEDGFPVLIDTANGTTTMRRGRLDRLAVGDIIVRDHAVLVGDAIGDTGVLGMNFLSGLRSWRVEGTRLILEP